MRRSSGLAVCLTVLALAAIAAGQVTSPMDISDQGPRALQSKYMDQLQKLGKSVRLQKYPYAFYFSRKLDIDEAQQKLLAQSGICFKMFDNKMVLAITGNYYVSYSAELVDRSHRVRQTFNDVILPMLRAAVSAFGNDEPFRTYGFEIAQHVRTKVLGVSTEAAENVVILLPREVAHKLAVATTPEQQQAAVLDAEVYLDSKPLVLWLTGDEPQVAPKGYDRSARDKKQAAAGAETQSPVGFDLTSNSDSPMVSERLVSAPSAPMRIVTPDTLRSLYLANEDTIARMTRELDPQAHFVPYVLPSFIAFRQGAYLQVPMTTELPTGTTGSQYRLAAMAFDQHIAHLVRPALAYFPGTSAFDGIDFSTTVKVPGTDTVQSVEFILGFQAMQCFAKYDCTGQQLLNAGAVLINGERAALDLQKAQATN